MTKRRTIAIGCFGAVLTCLAAGCASTGVEVWERDILARPEMQVDHRAHDQAIDDHIYFSKEASSGGRGGSGGGCGCN